MPIRVSRTAQPMSSGQTALSFLENNSAGSDIRVLFDGANFLSRTSHTAISKARYTHQAGYYTGAGWHSPNTGSWDGGAYSYGTHPFPCDGNFNGSGQATGGTGGSGETHYYEIAGVGAAVDWIAAGAGSALIVTKDIWVTQVRKCEVIGGTTLRHTYYPDAINNPSFAIVVDLAIASLGSAGENPAFYWGASDWRANIPSAGRNDETTYGLLRGLKAFNAPLSIEDALTEAASGLNEPVTAAGIANCWYMNENPTHTDIADKSGAGHHARWPTDNRPTTVDL